MTSSRAAWLEAIATRIADYRQGEVTPMTPAHVERWVKQFDLADQDTILEAMVGLLRAYYVSRTEAQGFVSRLLMDTRIFGPDLRQGLQHTQFLRIQRKGNSQNDLLSLVNEVLQAEHSLDLEACGADPYIYIYLDDCLFTGRTVINDLQDVIPTLQPGTELHLCFIALYQRNLDSVLDYLETLAWPRAVQVVCWRAHEFHDLKAQPGRFDGLWPVAIGLDPTTEAYIQTISTRFKADGPYPSLFRPPTAMTQDRLFYTAQARQVVEQAFLKAGAYICSLPAMPNPYLRPLGYEPTDGLGFGAFFVTYRNCPNNCPLALWWGEPGYSAQTPLGKWYPLFSRRPNATDNDW